MWSGVYSRAQGFLTSSGRKKSSGHHCCASLSYDKFLFHAIISVLYTLVINTLNLVLSPFPMKSWAKLCTCITFLITGLDISGAWHCHGSETPGTLLITSGTGATAACFKWGHTSVSLGLFKVLKSQGLVHHPLCWLLWHGTIWMDELVILIWLLAKSLHRKFSFFWHFFFYKMLENMGFENWKKGCLWNGFCASLGWGILGEGEIYFFV